MTELLVGQIWRPLSPRIMERKITASMLGVIRYETWNGLRYRISDCYVRTMFRWIKSNRAALFKELPKPRRAAKLSLSEIHQRAHDAVFGDGLPEVPPKPRQAAGKGGGKSLGVRDGYYADTGNYLREKPRQVETTEEKTR